VAARPPAHPAARSSSSEPGVGALDDECALELGQGTEDLEDQRPAGRRGVDRLRE